VVACLIPRAYGTRYWDFVCTDGVTYLEAAHALERCDFNGAFGYLGLNVYPLILIGLAKTGCEIVWIGKWWNVVLATLAVLPLFGWIRRQFDDQVATIGCLLYAFQPVLVEYTPMLMRDATFWMLFVLTIYLLWRAVTEIRWPLFAATGVSLTLAVYTRTEGWFLLVPAVLWTVFRLPAARGARVRLVGGVVLSLAMIPLAVAVVNLAWLGEHPRWTIVRDGDVGKILAWAGWSRSPQAACELSTTAPATASPAAPCPETPPAGTGILVAPPEPELPANGKPYWRVAEQVVLRLVKSCSYVYGLLAILGLWGWRQVYLRRDQQVLLWMSLLLCGAIWIHCSRGDICVRYFLPIVIASLPWVALGLLLVAAAIVRSTRGLVAWNPPRRLAILAALLAAVFVASMISVGWTPAARSRQSVAMGKWILSRMGPNRQIVCVNTDSRQTCYYARGFGYTSFVPRKCDTFSLPWLVRHTSPQVILHWGNFRASEDPLTSVKWLRAQREPCYREVPPDCLPPGCEDVVVLVRADEFVKLAPGSDQIGRRTSLNRPGSPQR
jgi:4-amino-4-deoxy-L-arabinose transferase-like glycosyltransferase